MGFGQSKKAECQSVGSQSDSRKKNVSGTGLADRLHRSRAAHLTHVLRTDSVDTQEADLSGDETDQGGQATSPINPMDYQFCFENLVMEGGGNKGFAYLGALKDNNNNNNNNNRLIPPQCLEEQGVLSGVRRFGGCSAGAVSAGLLACGHTATELERVLLAHSSDELFLDARFGALSLLPNLARTYGWHPADRFLHFFGQLVKDKMGDPDLTFQQLYHKTGRELCVVVTNLTQMSTEYCHPKTTPDMPIRLAVRMSAGIPVLFSAVKYSSTATDDVQDVIVDGGIMCNYPVHCFDGWYLSLKPEDTLLKRLQPLHDIPRLMQHRFVPTNDNTLGLLLYSEQDTDVMRDGLETRYVAREPSAPAEKTKLFVAWQKERRRKMKAEKEHDRIVKAIDAFLAVINKHNVHDKEVIDIKELEAAFQDNSVFPEEYAQVLFGKDFTVEEVFDLLDYDGNGEIHFDELVRFMENNGVNLYTCFLSKKRQNIDGFLSFITTLQNTLIHNLHKVHTQEADFERSIGINTGYVDTTCFTMEKADIQFLRDRGYNATKAFLQYFVAAHPDRVHKRFTSETGGSKHARTGDNA
ncbi:hypothetical protein ACOMHN_018870 [Nucella lapillus]